MDDWTTIYETAQLYQAEIVKGLLTSNGIEAIVMNQQDSSYVMVGTIKVMIRKTDQDKATKIIKSLNCE
ncbi:DUF2007 domain-containing protein [Odoribacter sp. Z80]|uniref:putative signal transducing protein n=1 Tax=Odoribacter sp. Z80 TaxID=2304575 RepID=UPI001379BDFA|nr:DUF2007 domain-containing protein [Odoribacter sp. Z80]NCE71385.1 DUF2007 domain-containing protein [Odoribacter sp. Z80]